MRTRHALALLILVSPILAARVAGAGWGWDNLLGDKPSTIAGAPSDDRALEVISRAIREGREAEAMELIRKTSKLPARLELARLQFAANFPAKGRRSLEKAAAENPADPRVYLLFGSLAFGEGRLSDAGLNAEKALALLDSTKPDADTARTARAEANAGLAAVAEAREDWASARSRLAAWLDLDPSNARARQRLGRALFRLGKPDDAFRELSRSAKDDPKLGPAALSMALLHVQAGDDPQAEDWFHRATSAEPRGAQARLAFARWRLDKGRAVEARSLVEQAATLDPKSKEIEPLRGLIAWQLRELAEAERIFEGLQKEAPNDAGYASLLTLALVEQDDPEKRARGLRQAEANARQFPGALDALAALGRAQARSGRRDDAERSLRSAVLCAGGRATPTIAYFLAEILAEKGVRDDARALLAQAVASPIAFAYQAEARKLLASLAEKPPARVALPTAGRVLPSRP